MPTCHRSLFPAPLHQAHGSGGQTVFSHQIPNSILPALLHLYFLHCVKPLRGQRAALIPFPAHKRGCREKGQKESNHLKSLLAQGSPKESW